jgi:hypothetical protein
MQMKSGALALALLLAISTPAAAKCRFSSIRIYPNFDATQSGQAASEEQCTIRFSNSYGGGLAAIKIAHQPKHGSVVSSYGAGFMSVTYKSNTGYKGSDEFVYTISSGTAKTHGDSNITVTMDVQ